MKRIISVLLILIMTATLVSCADREEGDITFESIEFNTVEADTGDETGADTEPVVPIDPDAPTVTAKFIGAGDNITYTGTFWEALAQGYPGHEYNFAPIYTDIAPAVQAADVAYINQECMMSGAEASPYPTFNCPREMAYDLMATGFNVINIANNHMLDQGGWGLGETIEFLDSLDGATMIGGNRNRAEFDDIEIIEANGVKIALLSYCEMTNIGLGKDYDIWIPYLDKDDIKKHCDSVRDKCDFILCSVHWGDEQWYGNMRYEPTDAQKEWAKYMADCGVDAIIGTHPHVIEPIEWIDASDGRRVLCAYSLGNFMAMQANYFNMLGGLLSFNINKKGTGHATISDVLFTPTVYYYAQSWYGSHVYYLSDFSDYLAASHGLSNYGVSISRGELETLLNLNIDNEFLPEEFRN